MSQTDHSGAAEANKSPEPRFAKLRFPELHKVEIDDGFWSDYCTLVREAVIPYQWEAFNDRIEGAEPSHAIENFKIAAGEAGGKFKGMIAQDSDLAKWIEAVGYSLESHPDEKLEALADGAIDLIAKAQQPDGYLNTYFTVKEPDKRWTDLFECHELYCAGHMLEAAVAYYKGTGKRKLLDVMCRYMDYIGTVFGEEPGKRRGYPGHEEIELALLKLYRVTGEEKYLKLSRYFVLERGKKPYYFDEEWEKRGKTNFWGPQLWGPSSEAPSAGSTYNQYHLPAYEQDTAEGHAVRAVYFYTAMADLAGETGDEKLLGACRAIWKNIVTKRMYVTGGIGSTSIGEAFTFDYDLPNDTVYSETCASIGLIFFASRMLQIERKGEYADVIERALYNVVLASMSRDGHRFFYVNPLEVWPEASEKNPTRRHVKPVRQPWFGCACCPPNLARLLASLGRYVYGSDDRSVWCHLYIGGSASFETAGGVTLRQQTDYPWGNRVQISVGCTSGAEFTLALRIPGWCRRAAVTVDGSPVTEKACGGYLKLQRVWHGGEQVELVFDMPVEAVEANPQVRADAGKVALTRGPLVYCLEEADNGANLSAIRLLEGAAPAVEADTALPGGAVAIRVPGMRRQSTGWDDALYRPLSKEETPVIVKAIPYCLWGNRAPGEMQVWTRIED